jgi:hypothetical protein
MERGKALDRKPNFGLTYFGRIEMSNVAIKDLPCNEEIDTNAVRGGYRVVGDVGSLSTPGVADIAVANGADPVAAYGEAAVETWYSIFGPK